MEGSQEVSSPPPTQSRFSYGVPQGFIRLSLENLPGQRPHNLSEQPALLLRCSHGEETFPVTYIYLFLIFTLFCYFYYSFY